MLHKFFVTILFLVGTGCQQDQSRTETIAAFSTSETPANQVAPEPGPEVFTKGDYENIYVKAAAGKFIAKYPDDPRVAEIEHRLESMKIK